MSEVKPRSVPVRVPDARDDQIDAIGRLVLSMVDGAMTVAEIGACFGLDENEACLRLDELSRAGLIEIPSGGEGGPDEGGSRGPREERGEDASELEAMVREAFESLDARNHYELLDVAPDADRKELRAAYFSRSKQFHPDKAFGRNREQLLKMMGAVFGRITKAYEILSAPGQRAAYDASIADQIEMWRLGRQLTAAVESARSMAPKASAKEQTQEPPARPSRPLGDAGARGVRTSVQPRQGVARPISSRPAVHRPAPKAQSQPPDQQPGRRDSDQAAKREQWRRERIGRALGMAISVPPQANVAPARNSGAEEKLKQAEIAIERGECADASRLLHAVMEVEPQNPIAARLMERAKEGATQAAAQGHVRQGRHEWKSGNTERAMESFERALACDPRNLEARHLMAEVLLEQRRELPRAMTLARELIALGGQRARYFATLGELLLLAKENARAQNAFERAVSLEPDNREYKKRLKACKK